MKLKWSVSKGRIKSALTSITQTKHGVTAKREVNFPQKTISEMKPIIKTV